MAGPDIGWVEIADMEESSLFAAVLSIAGVSLRISFVDTPPGGYESWYLPFFSPSSADKGLLSAMDISVLRDRATPSDALVVFESGGAWNMQMDSNGYRLNFHREGSRSYHTVACSDSGTTRVQVYIDQDQEDSGRSSEACSPRVAPSPIRYPLDQLLLMNHLAPLGGMIVHGAGIVIGETAVLCPGASGAGKSTLSRLFMDAGLGDSLLSDDRVVLRTSPSDDQAAATGPSGDEAGQRQVDAWGTPWPGDAGVARNATAPLDAVLFLVKADSNELRRLSPSAAARRLMPVASCPWYDLERLPGVLETCSHVVENTSCYELLFRADKDIVGFLAGRPWVREEESS